MRIRPIRYRDQRIAVFGESGSGKTVLLSSFYGSTQEPTFLRSSPFRVIAENPGQGNRLMGNYLGMKNEARLPESTRLNPESFVFSVTMPGAPTAQRDRPFDAIRLTWFDYPGEWFEQDTTGPTEAALRTETFENLLGSDVAFLLVDGARLREHAGEEERYLKSLFHNFRTGMVGLHHRLAANGTTTERFPRIWMLALTKSDLFDDFDVFAFRDLVIAKAAEDLEALRAQIETMVGDPEALSVGEDFLVLSSAKFEPGMIEVDRRVGVDLILPLAAILPFERHVWWASKKLLPGRLAAELVERAGMLADALLGRGSRLPFLLAKGRKLTTAGLVLSFVKHEHVRAALDLAGTKLAEANERALAEHDHLLATLTGFKIAVEAAEREDVLLRSNR